MPFTSIEIVGLLEDIADASATANNGDDLSSSFVNTIGECWRFPVACPDAGSRGLWIEEVDDGLLTPHENELVLPPELLAPKEYDIISMPWGFLTFTLPNAPCSGTETVIVDLMGPE